MREKQWDGHSDPKTHGRQTEAETEGAETVLLSNIESFAK